MRKSWLAGIAVAAPLEFLPPEELTHQLDVNVVGQLRVLQAFLPALRESHGRVVLMGSVAGRSALPFLGAYVSIKDTVASFKEILEGKADDLPEQAFFLAGTLDDVRENAKKLSA